jgi:16S rRNA (uracil1498-N3)-methyltransferase
MDFIIEKAVELGAYSLVPFISEHSVSRPDGDAANNKLRRFRKISEAAAKQCGRGIIPHIGELTDLRRILGQSEYDLRFFADEKERELDLGSYLADNFGHGVLSAAFFIGPEGGFSDAERGLFLQAGVTPLSLGRRILRSETAAMYILSCVSCFLQANIMFQNPASNPEVWREGIYNRRFGCRPENAR